MNNRGQSLVTFVLVLPILLLILLALYDIGNMVILKNELRNVSYIALDYGINNIDNPNLIEDMKALILKNKSDIDDVNVIKDEDDKIHISFSDSVNTKISFSNIFKIKVSYVGYVNDDKKVIERDN